MPRFKTGPAARIIMDGVSGSEILDLLASITESVEIARAIVDRFSSLDNIAKASVSELMGIKGVGQAMAVRVQAAMEVGRRRMYETTSRDQIKTPADAAGMLMVQLGVLEQEEVHVLQLDARNHVIAQAMVYRGSLNSASMRIGELFKGAIRNCCAAIIVAHNHPSGDPAPSAEDVRVTKAVVDAGKLLDIEVLDHIVVCKNSYCSLKERGLGFG